MLSAWQIDVMKEAEDARIWEELNAPDPAEKQMQEAAVSMKQAEELISKAEDYLVDAVYSLSEFPMSDKVASLEDDLEDLRYSIKSLREKYERGCRD